MYLRPPKGNALIRIGIGGRRVYFGGALVIPVFHRAEFFDLTEKPVPISLTGKEGLRCRDGIRADITMVFFLRIIPNPESILDVHVWLGTKRAGDANAIQQIFEAKFLEAIKRCARERDFDDLEARQDEFRRAVLEVIGEDLNGFGIEGSSIDSLRETPLEFLDPQNILDAEGIKKITDRQAKKESQRRALEREREKREAIERVERERGRSEEQS